MIRLSPVDSPHLIWPVVEASLLRVKAKTGERWTPPFVLSRLNSGDAKLFRVHGEGTSGFMVCEIYAQGEKPWLNIWIMEGSGFTRSHSPKLISQIDVLAKSVGCVAWRCVGRRGWARFLKPIAQVYEREVL